jgi:hypothetical protein
VTSGADRPRIFTFWEPRGAITPYLELCRETWARGISGYEVVTLDYANLAEYVGAGTVDLEPLRMVPLSVQKDAIMVAVLYRHGGLFMDLDTIVVRDLAPVIARLDDAPIVTFGRHLAFTGARRGDPVVAEWLEAVQRNLGRLREGSVSAAEAPWSFLGNMPLDDVMRARRDRRFPFNVLSRLREAPPTDWRARRTRAGALVNRIDAVADRAAPGAPWRRLDRTTFLPELIGVRHARRRMHERYLGFWFEPGDVASAIRRDTTVVALHNSWTPDWYRALTRDEVLAHDCRLSAVLRHLRLPKNADRAEIHKRP